MDDMQVPGRWGTPENQCDKRRIMKKQHSPETKQKNVLYFGKIWNDLQMKIEAEIEKKHI
jgi:hypothetical protein